MGDFHERWERRDGKASAVHLQCQIRDDGNEIGIPAPFSISVDRSLNLGASFADRRKRVGDRAFRIVVRMDPEGDIHFFPDIADDLCNLPRHGSPVRVAQHDDLGTPLPGGGESRPCILRVGFVAIEEMLGVIEHSSSLFNEKSGALLDNAQILLRCGSENLAYMEH